MKKGVPIKLDLRNWNPKLVHELSLNDAIGPKIEQMELKEMLLKKHGMEKLKRFQSRKRPFASRRKKKPF